MDQMQNWIEQARPKGGSFWTGDPWKSNEPTVEIPPRFFFLLVSDESMLIVGPIFTFVSDIYVHSQ